MKLSLKSQFRSTVAGIVALAVPGIILSTYSGTNTRVVIALCLTVCSVASYYQGAVTAEQTVLESQAGGIHCYACDGVKNHFYDCPEAQE